MEPLGILPHLSHQRPLLELKEVVCHEQEQGFTRPRPKVATSDPGDRLADLRNGMGLCGNVVVVDLWGTPLTRRGARRQSQEGISVIS